MASWFSRHETLQETAPVSGWWVRIKTGLGLEAEEQAEPTLLQQVDQVTTLNRTQVGLQRVIQEGRSEQTWLLLWG